MPINKDALVRYRIINKCLVNRFKKFPNKETLKEACMEALGVDYISTRTIEKDLEEMRYNEELGYMAPIEYSKKEKGYWYTDPNYSIDKIPLKNDDLNALQFAASILTQFSHLSILKEFSGAVSKIMEAVNINRLTLEDPELDFIEFDKADYIPGGPFLEKLVEAIKDNHLINFVYKKHGKDESKTYQLEPYLLKQYKNIWYIIGNEPSSKAIKTFGLDRVISIEVTSEKFTPAKDFDKKKYFKNSFGITSYHGEPENILLSFTKKTGDYIKALPLHNSQKILSEKDNEYLIQLTVYPTFDLIMQLLSYGSEVAVLQPESLRKDIISVLETTLKRYK